MLSLQITRKQVILPTEDLDMEEIKSEIKWMILKIVAGNSAAAYNLHWMN